MKAEHLNAFIQGAQNTFSMFFGENARLGKVFLKTSPYKADNVCVEIDIVGDITGSVFYNMNTQSACFVASKLMMGMEVASLDEMAQSAVCEMTNMISGQVATVFFGEGTTIDITAPVMRLDAEPNVFTSISVGAKVICIPLAFPNGDIFEIDLLLT